MPRREANLLFLLGTGKKENQKFGDSEVSQKLNAELASQFDGRFVFACVSCLEVFEFGGQWSTRNLENPALGEPAGKLRYF